MVSLVLRAAVGAGAAAGFIGGAAYVQRTAGTAVAQGIYGATGLAAGGLALVAVPPLSGPLGWRAPWVLAAVGTLACLAVAVSGPATPRVGRADRAPQRPSILRVAASPLVVRLGVLHAASFGFSVVLGNWCVTLLEHAGHGKDFAGVAGATHAARRGDRPARRRMARAVRGARRISRALWRDPDRGLRGLATGRGPSIRGGGAGGRRLQLASVAACRSGSCCLTPVAAHARPPEWRWRR